MAGLVLYSGGCDSTLLLYQLLDATPRHTIRAITVSQPQIVDNAKLERASFLKWLDKFYGFEHITVELNDSIGGAFIKGGNLLQPALWLTIATLYLKEDENLYVGYIKQDCVWHYKDKMEALFANLQSIHGKTGKLVFSMEWQEKQDIISELIRLKLYDYTVSCEESGKTPCGKCEPCWARGLAEHRLLLTDKKKYKNKLGSYMMALGGNISDRSKRDRKHT